MFRARAKRWQVRYPVQVACQDFVDEARTANVSLHGLSVETNQTMQLGSQVYVRVLLPDRASSVDYAICTVQWAADGKIGLEACGMRTTDERRLHRHLSSLSVWAETKGQPSVPVAPSPSRTTKGPSFVQRLMKPLMAATRGAQRFAGSTRKILPD